MPDSGLTDGVAGFTASFHDTYIRQQVCAQVTSSTRPTNVNGRLIAETDTTLFQVGTGSTWVPFGGWGAYPAYTPTISASTTPPTGWTTSGNYTQIGKTVIGRATFTFGAGTAASGNLRFGLPVTAAAGATGFVCGNLTANDSGTTYFRVLYLAATTYVESYSEAGAAVTGIAPFTPGAADFYRIQFCYEAA